MEQRKDMPARPTVTKEMILEVATIVAERMGGADAETIADNYTHPMDGFDLAKLLDKRECWDTTREDMEVLDSMAGLVDRALVEAEKQWAAQNSITPPIAIGSRVRCPARNRIGVIDSICDYSVACYLVTPEEPDERELASKARWVIKFEDAELA